MRLAILTGLAALSLAAAAARAEVVDRSPAGFELRQQVVIATTPERAYRALTAEVGRWWNPAHTLSGDPRNLSFDVVGGCFCEIWPGGRVRHMSIVDAEPGKALGMLGAMGPFQHTGASGHLNFAFTADGGKTTVTATFDAGGYARRGLAETLAEPADGMLGDLMGRLKRYLETGKPDEAPQR